MGLTGELLPIRGVLLTVALGALAVRTILQGIFMIVNM